MSLSDHTIPVYRGIRWKEKSEVNHTNSSLDAEKPKTDLAGKRFQFYLSGGYKAVLVEGNPKNYNPRGFVTSADHGIIAGPNIHLPHVSCLMIKELVRGALDHIHGEVDYSFYNTLHEG